MGETDAGAEARWAKSTARAAGLADLGIGAAVTRYFLVNFPLALLLGVGIGFALASLWPETNGDFVRSGFSLGLQLAGLGIFIGGWIYGSRKISPAVQPRRIGVTVGLTADEAKHVRRRILSNGPVDDADGTVLRGAAVQLREGLARQLVTAPGFLVLFAGQAVGRGKSSVFDVVMILAILGLVVLFGFVVRQFKQTGAFLPSTAPLDPMDGPDPHLEERR